MPCSAVTLSLATITAIVAVALLAIAFSTDNWLYIEVKRAQIQQQATKRGDLESLLDSMKNKYYYYTRTKGLFRICFPKDRPSNIKIYMSPVETLCTNIDYYIPDVDNVTKTLSDDAMARLHMGRSMIALFIVAFFTVFVAFWTGVAGCWRRSPGNITSTAILMLLACLLSAGGMGLWHGVEYYEKEKVVGEEFYQQWSNELRAETSIRYDWSYILAWISVGFYFISSVFFFSAANFLRSERKAEKARNVQYIMPGIAQALETSESLLVLRENSHISYDWSYIVAWIGVGWALVSAILFSAAAICLRGEREKEEAMNMQYLMPVYPQKQQYAYATGYPGAGAYPGPYYHGSQYGPYNY